MHHVIKTSFLLAAICVSATQANTQEIETPQPAIELSRLLSVGYEVVSSSVLTDGAGFVIFLQRANSLYICEINSLGVTKICIETK